MADKTYKVIIEVTGKDNASKPLSTIGDSLGGLKTQYLAVAGGVMAALAVMKKAYEFGEEGANIMRLEQAGADLAESFGADMDEIVAALTRASQGTVAKTDIILSANRAMMLGLGADADKLANLMEVAAVRGRAMGVSTTQAFSDIVTGIGRMSPMILDNLGIVVDSEARFSAYAESIGTTADKLDAATRKQVLLDGVLEEGNKMLAQTGGLVADTATAYEQLETATRNATDAGKEHLAEALVPIISNLALAISAYDRLEAAVSEHEAAYIASGMAYEDYVRAMVHGLTVSGQMKEITEDQILALMADQSALEKATEQYGELDRAKIIDLVITGQMTEEQGDYLNAILATESPLEDLLEEYGLLTDAEYTHAEATKGMTGSSIMAADAQERLERQNYDTELSFERVAMSAEDVQAAYDVLQMTIRGPLREENESFIEQQKDLEQEMGKVSDRIDELSSQDWLPRADREELEELKGKYGELQAQYGDNAAAHQEATKSILFDLMSQRAAIDGVTEAEYRVLTDIAQKWGLIDEETATAIAGIDQAFSDLAAGEDLPTVIGQLTAVGEEAGLAADTADQELDAFASGAGVAAAIDSLTEIKSIAQSIAGNYGINFNITTTGSYPNPYSGNTYSNAPGKGEGAIEQAEGGSWLVTEPTLFLAGEAGPEYADFTPRRNAKRKGREGGDVFNIINNNRDAASAALAMAWIDQARRSRLEP